MVVFPKRSCLEWLTHGLWRPLEERCDALYLWSSGSTSSPGSCWLRNGAQASVFQGQCRKLTHGATWLNCLNSWVKEAGSHLSSWEEQMYSDLHRCNWIVSSPAAAAASKTFLKPVPGLFCAPSHAWQLFERVLLGMGQHHEKSHATN